MASSIQEYRLLVEEEAERLRKRWLNQFKEELRTLSVASNERGYWETLIMMAELDWASSDHDVRQAVDEGMRRYQREEDGNRDFPPSAAYMKAQLDGTIVYPHLDPTGTPGPRELIQKHIELVKGKRQILSLINQFVEVAKKLPTANLDRPPDPLELTARLQDIEEQLQHVKEVVGNASIKLKEVCQKRSDDMDWNFAELNHLPTQYQKHESVLLMRQQIEQMRQTRQSLEQAVKAIRQVGGDDKLSVVEEAIAGIGLIRETDPENKKYGVLNSRLPRRWRAETLTLQWQARALSLKPASGQRGQQEALEEIAKALEELRDEQKALDTFLRAAQRRANKLAGPLLALNLKEVTSLDAEISLLWQRLNQTASERMACHLWTLVVKHGKQLGSLLGHETKLYRLEYARRQVKFDRAGGDSIVELADELLKPLNDDHKSSQSPTEYLSTQSFSLERASLAQLKAVLSNVLEKYDAKQLPSVEPGNNPNAWPEPKKRKVLSYAAYEQLFRLKQLYDRISIVVEWVRDYRHNCDRWESSVVQLVRHRIPKARGQAQARLVRRLLNICPDFPEYRHTLYNPQLPPLSNRRCS